MKVPLKWLKEYVNISLPPAEVANHLTMAGAEVKDTQIIGGAWENVIVGQIVAINPHPNADRLTLPTVNLGAEQVTVVCGAPNLKIGDKVAFARVGAELIDPQSGKLSKLKPARIRGVESRGMVCSEKELGISDRHEGILVLPEAAPVGTPLADYLGDAIFDLDVTPNRPDCLSVIGIAREIAALTGQDMRLSDISYEESGLPIEQQISVEIADSDLCPRYCASLITDITIAESPAWMQERLLACGMRPINNVVDITNYVMLEYGQPLHSFDYERIRGKKIIVRRAGVGETIVSLDGADRKLSTDMLVIADANRPVAVAGVMGGANSEVSEDTTSILLEAASFKPESIHYTSRHLSMTSEASMRFERGIRAGLAMPALRRATRLIVQLAGGKAAKGVIDVYPGKQADQPVSVSLEKVNRLLGADFNPEQVVNTLKLLSFECQPAGSSRIQVSVPYWRSDIHWEVDVIEEVARIIGYDKIPMTMLSQPIPRQNPHPLFNLKRKVGRVFTGCGFQETLSFTLTSLEMAGKLLPDSHSPGNLLRMSNPMTVEQEYLRPNLRANLLATFAANRRYEDGGLRLFEMGKVFLPRPDDLPEEPEVLCAILGGPRLPRWWQASDEPIDFFDAKGVASGLLAQLGVTASFAESTDESLYPDEQLAIVVAGKRVGIIGKIRQQVLEAFDIAEPVYLLEMDISALLPFTVAHRMFQPIPRFPAVIRDIALVVDTGVTHQQIVDIIRGFPLVSEVSIFDVYRGKQVPPGKKSLAYRIIYQSPTHTLTDEEVDGVQRQILEKLSSELGATLRG